MNSYCNNKILILILKRIYLSICKLNLFNNYYKNKVLLIITIIKAIKLNNEFRFDKVIYADRFLEENKKIFITN